MEDRFTRARWLFGSEFDKLQKAHVLVCGCGGVGGACIEALYRSGVVNLSVIDCDVFEITNQNRQIGSQCVGEIKTDVFTRLYEGIMGINLNLSPAIIEELDLEKYDFVVDCIDDIPAKVALAKRVSHKLISSMGGAKRLDPMAIKVASIWKTTDDPFAKKIRYELKKSDFKGDYDVVFSTETPKGKELGSYICVTASFGLHLANLCIKKIIDA